MALSNRTTSPTEITLKDRVENALVRSLIGGASALPYPWRVPGFAKANRHVISPLAGYRKRALENLALVWPEMPPDKRRRIADAALENSGRVLIENYSHPTFFERAAQATPEGPGLAALEEAAANGTPVILATGHFGNYEAPRAALIARGHPVGGLYRPMSNPLVNAHYAKTMESFGPPVFAQGRPGLKGLIRHLSGGGMAVILTDVHEFRAEVFDFLGVPAHTSTSAAELALRYKAALVPFYGTRQAGGLDYRVELEAPIPHTDPIQMTQALIQSLEARILADPGQWFWIHRRWKS